MPSLRISYKTSPLQAADPTKQVAKAKKPTVKPAHPSYAVMIAAAINALKERDGSSRQVSLKYVLAYYRVADIAYAQIRAKLAITKMLAAKTIVQVKGSFELIKEDKASNPIGGVDPVILDLEHTHLRAD